MYKDVTGKVVFAHIFLRPGCYILFRVHSVQEGKVCKSGGFPLL